MHAVHALRPSADTLSAPVLGTVAYLDDAGCAVDLPVGRVAALVATHIPSLAPGQRVIVHPCGEAGHLITAAFPLPGQQAKPLAYDPATGTLRIQAPRLDLAAVAAIELRCGEARLRLSVDGRVEIEGVDIVSAALSSNRIEGASIDLN